ncbi:uncharacterized protein LOC102075886 isoform X2 [Oreochromis niloticus]|uniref:Uncharacterized LOC102075886 n=1 Tax=Oreochromis niloticus TaxID=8128 RepID=A0A669CN81_ORENI|nr:uncharacterized protein LOC102075886 isoform X2 [Oreochromis niloticus]
MAAQKDQPGDEYTFKWTKEQTADFIKTRGENNHLFTGVKNSATVGWRTILEKMGLQGKVTPLQAKKKWDNLKKRYKDCKCPGSGQGVSGKPTAATWPWFGLMDEVMGQRPSIRSPVLISFLPEDTPGPSTAVGDQSEREEETDEEGGQPATTGRKRRRDRGGMSSLSSSKRTCSTKGRLRRGENRRAGTGWTDFFLYWKD